ncbi:MAG: bacillithiol biosynthesis protein BshC [Promethearchaeota archaeon]
MQDILQHYMDLTLSQSQEIPGLKLKPYVPTSYHDAYTRAEELRSKIIYTPEDLEIRATLGEIFRTTTKSYGAFTAQAKKNLEIYLKTGGLVEIGHQPKFLGGERFLLNKLASGGCIPQFSPNLVPFLYIGDYDKVHVELIKTRIPVVNSATGLSLSIDKSVEELYNNDSIRCLPKPTEEYLHDVLDSIRRSYQFSLRQITPDSTPNLGSMYEERVEQALHIINRSYHASTDYAEWFGNIVATLTNIVGDYGMQFIRASNPRLQQLMLPHYEYLLQHREKYVKIYQQTFDTITEQGFTPPLRKITADFVPFFVECPQNHCNSRRILLSATKTQGKVLLKGKCDGCGSEIEFETSTAHPDLSEWTHNLAPRVDSRQFVVSSVISPQIHIAGTGETQYYMMDLPLLSQFNPDLKLPIIYFYNKTTFNTPFTRYLEIPLKEIPDYFPALKALMKNVGKFKKLTKKKPIPPSSPEHLKELKERILRCRNLLSTSETNFDALHNVCVDALENPQLAPEILQNVLPAYKANFFGEISKERSGQEAVFHWIDLLVKNGLRDLFADYAMIYKPWQSPGLKIQL